MSEYEPRILQDLGEHYTRHVEAMTKEELHSKSEIAAELAWRDKLLIKMIDVVGFYADPGSYFAIGFFPDPPNGEFMNDFSDTDLGWKPGKRARDILDEESK